MNDDCCYKLYMHLNKTNGKVYIGQTKKSYGSRWNNGKGYGQCSRFATAIKKYGWNGFEHIPLIEGLSKIDADYFERFFIDVFDSQNSEFGYNLTAGGDENPMDTPVVRAKYDESIKKRSANPEWRENQRVGAKKRVTNPEWRENVRKANQKLHADPEYQKKHREAMKKLPADPHWWEKYREGIKKRSANPEWQKNHREALKKIHADPKWQEKVREASQKRCKKVLCVETKIVYNSLKEAVIAVNLKTHTPICLCCSGKRKTAGGYHWEYA